MVAPGKEIVEEGGAQAAQMQVAGGTGREPHAHSHLRRISCATWRLNGKMPRAPNHKK